MKTRSVSQSNPYSSIELPRLFSSTMWSSICTEASSCCQRHKKKDQFYFNMTECWHGTNQWEDWELLKKLLVFPRVDCMQFPCRSVSTVYCVNVCPVLRCCKQVKSFMERNAEALFIDYFFSLKAGLPTWFFTYLPVWAWNCSGNKHLIIQVRKGPMSYT